MTHSLHRRGSRDSLKNDYVWQPYPARNVNDDNLSEKFSKIIEIAEKVGSPNWGDVKTGPKTEVGVDEIIKKLSQKSRVRGVFTKKEDVVSFLKKMKKADIGLSLVISGLIDEVLDACASAELRPHTINLSLGVWGNKKLLPKEEILEITTMCGHHMISPQIVEAMKENVEKGLISPEAASLKLAKLCPCGIFNPVRAADLLTAKECSCGDTVT